MKFLNLFKPKKPTYKVQFRKADLTIGYKVQFIQEGQFIHGIHEIMSTIEKSKVISVTTEDELFTLILEFDNEDDFHTVIAAYLKKFGNYMEDINYYKF